MATYLCNRFSEPNPRKGTETKGEDRAVLVLAGFSEPNPRKGTETLLDTNEYPFFFPLCFSEPNPRKGTETAWAKMPISSSERREFFRT